MDQPTEHPTQSTAKKQLGREPQQLVPAEPRWLLPRFALYTLLILSLTASAIIWMTKQSATTHVEQQVGRQTQFVANTLIRDHLSSADLARPMRGARLQHFEAWLHRDVLVNGALRAKIYNRSGLVIYSTDHSQIGTRDSVGVKEALSGKLFGDVTTLGAEKGRGQGEHPASTRVLEAYTPLRGVGSSKKIDGAFEIYQTYAPVEALARQEVTPVALALAASLFALYLALFPILRRTTKALRQRNRLLSEQASELKETLEKRIEIEETLRQTQKMDAVGRLAGGIAHDFNNLLLVIRGYTSLILADIDEESPQRGDVGEIEKAAERATALTSQLLTFSRRQPIHFKTFDVHDAVEESYSLLSRLLTENIQVFVDPNRDPCYVHADTDQMAQVIMNLAVNARDAMPDGGTLRLKVRPVEVKKQHGQIPAGHYVALSVTDNGHGMSAETMSRIFEPFYTTKDVGKGTGLGLSIVYGIVAQSGGYIDVESEEGKGTTFTVYLAPATDIPVGPGIVKKALPSQKLKGTVLLVEDEEAVRQLLSGTLSKHGFDVLEAANGKEALEMASRYEKPIDLLLTDVVMPEMGGPQLADRLSTLRPEIRILFISGHPDRAFDSDNGGRLDQMLADGDSFLQKPFDIPTLLEKVRDVMGKTPAPLTRSHP